MWYNSLVKQYPYLGARPLTATLSARADGRLLGPVDLRSLEPLVGSSANIALLTLSAFGMLDGDENPTSIFDEAASDDPATSQRAWQAIIGNTYGDFLKVIGSDLPNVSANHLEAAFRREGLSEHTARKARGLFLHVWHRLAGLPGFEKALAETRRQARSPVSRPSRAKKQERQTADLMEKFSLLARTQIERAVGNLPPADAPINGEEWRRWRNEVETTIALIWGEKGGSTAQP